VSANPMADAPDPYLTRILSPSRVALLVVDVQNDFCHEDEEMSPDQSDCRLALEEDNEWITRQAEILPSRGTKPRRHK
jgi:hypothetical protein